MNKPGGSIVNVICLCRMATEEFGEVETPSVEIKLFGKWSSDEVHVNDISLAVSIP